MCPHETSYCAVQPESRKRWCIRTASKPPDFLIAIDFFIVIRATGRPPRPPRGAPGASRRVFAAWKGLLGPRIPARPRFAGWRRAGAAAVFETLRVVG